MVFILLPSPKAAFLPPLGEPIHHKARLMLGAEGHRIPSLLTPPKQGSTENRGSVRREEKPPQFHKINAKLNSIPQGLSVT